MNSTPPRWLDGASGASEPLRALLKSAAVDDPTLDEIAHVRRRLDAALAPSATPPAATSTLGRVRIGVIVAAVIVAAAGLAVGRRHATTSARTTTSETSPSASTSSARTVDPPPTSSATNAPLASQADTTSSVPPSATFSAHASAPIAVAAPSAPSFTDEVSLVAAAHAALRAGNATSALQLANEHAKRFPLGALAQEREVLAIEALLRLGRRAAAEARVARFRASFPSSIHLHRLEVLLAE